MATNLIKMQIQLRRDYAANWELHKDVVPAAGEPCFVIDKNILKIGDGVTTFEKLDAIGGVKIDIDGESLVFKDGVLQLAGFDAAEIGAQPRKAADGTLEWVVPSTKVVDDLQTAVKELQTDISGLKNIVGTPEGATGTLLSRVEGLEKEMDTIVSGLTDDGKVNTMMELISYVESHGKEAANMASDIKTLQQLVGGTSVNDQIMAIVKESGHMSEKKANAVFEHVKYEISHKPAGTLVDYRDKEIRVMVPAGHKWEKQSVGGAGNANMYYMGFKAYAPEGAVSFKEGDRGVIIDEMFDFNGDFAGTDEFGRKYSICWLALASYDSSSNTWNYYGKNSTIHKYIGWTYCVEWYDANGVVIGSDSIRINLSNEACHRNIEPYYMNAFVKEVSVNGTLLELVEGRINIEIPEIKSSNEIAVSEDGTLSINTISFDKIVQNPETVIVMDGGSAV